ncbi:hypothetical protein NI17_022380 [Thermobifida halotolerans]|uniref:Uncharacterized protein n=1 Tax=Thermobifida halotolerans TaxID=483545 RepID=A0A399G253_9ACTN|nr:hypothetical protein [Thermobifida halotolerans]UOE19434.1 hypothetical protein NI17_022380 [Thermobifida halotolerans]
MSGSDIPRSGAELVTIVIAPDDMSAEVLIQGGRQVVHGADAKATRRAALDYVAGYATHVGRPVLVEARDAFGTHRLEALPGGVIRGVTETSPPASAGRTQRWKRGRGVFVLAAAVLLVVVLVSVAGVVVFRLGADSPMVGGEVAETVETVPFEARPAPPGFSAEAVWRIPVTDGTRPAVADDGTRVAFIGADGKLAVAGPEGGRLWEAELPLDPTEIQGPVRFVAENEELRVAVAGPSTLWIWPADGGEPEEYPLPGNGLVTFAGTAPLVTTDDGEAMVPRDGELAEVEVPDGSGGMLVHESEVLLAAADGPWYWTAPGAEPEEVPIEEPEGSDGLDRVITASERYVIVRWQSGADDLVVLAVHDSRDGSVFAATEITAGELADATWIEGETVAAYGPILVDLESGQTRVLSGFAPLSATGDVVYGELDDRQVAVDATGETTNMEPDTARPWGLLDGNAVVLADANLYALLPG